MNDTKTTRFELRLTKAQKEALRHAAEAAHVTLADYLRRNPLPSTAKSEGLVAA
jgi:uncharacterized protein (DUF1778 family)